jgi:uncharacterized coiled-coil protein SlyX
VIAVTVGTSGARAIPDMQRGFFARILDRVVANVRVIRGAPEAITLTAIVAGGMSYFAFQQFHRERLAALNDRIASQEQLLTDYRTKLRGATPAEAATKIENLTSSLADTKKSLSETKSKLALVDNRSRDPLRLYEDNNPIALVKNPYVDLERKKITFLGVNSGVLLGIGKSYEFQNWKLACGGTQLYNAASDGAVHEYSYSPLTCKIVGNR